MEERVPKGCIDTLLKYVLEAPHDQFAVGNGATTLAYMYLAEEQFDLAQQVHGVGIYYLRRTFRSVDEAKIMNEAALFSEALRRCKDAQLHLSADETCSNTM